VNQHQQLEHKGKVPELKELRHERIAGCL
jgi:hypothetical protein